MYQFPPTIQLQLTRPAVISNVSGMAEFRIRGDQPAPVLPLHIETSRRANYSLRHFVSQKAMYKFVVEKQLQ